MVNVRVFGEDAVESGFEGPSLAQIHRVTKQADIERRQGVEDGLRGRTGTVVDDEDDAQASGAKCRC